MKTAAAPNKEAEPPQQAGRKFTSGDPDIDRLLDAALKGDLAGIKNITSEIVARPDMQALNKELLTEARATNLQIAEQERLEQ